MKKDRFLAYNNAILVIIVIIMVLELPQPARADWTSLQALRSHFLVYAINFLQLTTLGTTHYHIFNLVASH